jgi:inhibitor of cysteine peptidase
MTKKQPERNKERKSLIVLAGLIVSVVVILSSSGVIGFLWLQNLEEKQIRRERTIVESDSCEDIKKRLVEYQKKNRHFPGEPIEILDNNSAIPPTAGDSATDMAIPMQESESSAASGSDYSDTNNQVEGIDEGDIIKTDGRYIYTVSANNQVNITELNPNTGKLTKIKKIDLSDKILDIDYLNLYRDKLIIFGSENTSKITQNENPREAVAAAELIAPYSNQTRITLYNLDNPQEPQLVKDYSINGQINTTRQNTNILYFINEGYLSSNKFYDEDFKDISESDLKDILPEIRDNMENKRLNDDCKIYSTESLKSLNYSLIAGLDLDSDEVVGSKTLMTGSGDIYASKDNLYLTDYIYNPDNKGITTDQTTIYKFNFNQGNLSLQVKNEVPGRIVNQFAMDEFEGNFRIATTVQPHSEPIPFSLFDSRDEIIRPPRESQTNGLYIFDENLNKLGEVTNLARNEDIFSVRFMGDRAFMVTFEKVDPLFTFDLSDPNNPQVLGELKIPGFSDYLHPVSDNMLVGIGKNTSASVDDPNPGFSWEEGVKIGLFDVSNMSDPQEVDFVEIGDRGSDTEVLRDHKAFLWDERNNYLALPIEVRVTEEEADQDQRRFGPSYGKFQTQGSYVFEIKDNEILEKGSVSHLTEDDIKEQEEQGYYYQDNYPSYVRRQLYVNDYLITYSDNKLKTSRIENLNEVSLVSFPVEKTKPQPIQPIPQPIE